MTLDELSMDALTEIFNLGMGQAADALSQIAGDTVLLRVPRIRVIKRAELHPELLVNGGDAVSAVRQHYDGGVRCEAILMFPAAQSLQLVQMMVGSDLGLEQLAEMEQEALSEVGNILLNAVMASVSSALNIQLEGSLPTVESNRISGVIGAAGQDPGGSVLLVDIQFELASREVQGLLAFMLDLASEAALESLLRRFVGGA